MSAIGNRQQEPLGGDFKTNLGLGLLFLRVVAGPVELLMRKGAGHRYWWPALFSALLPLLAAEAIPKSPYGLQVQAARQVQQAVCVMAAKGLFILWLLRFVGSQFRRGRVHSLFCGRFLFFSGPKPFLEMALGLGLAYLLSFVSPPLANLMAFSGVATLLSVHVAEMRRKEAIRVARDQMFEAELFADDLRRHRGY